MLFAFVWRTVWCLDVQVGEIYRLTFILHLEWWFGDFVESMGIWVQEIIPRNFDRAAMK
jgi:hypothetical protein